MADNDNKIIVINPSDLISESMHKINHNFEVIVNDTDVFEQKLAAYASQVKSEIESLKQNNDSRTVEVLDNINTLNDKINSFSNTESIQNMVDAAVMNATYDLSNFIKQQAGIQVAESLGGYAKQSDFDNISAAFNNYKTDIDNRYASTSLTAANSVYARDGEGNLIYNDENGGESSGYTSIEDYYYYAEGVKESVDPDNKGLTDLTVVNNLVTLCESKFETVATELADINVTVGDGFSSSHIISQIEGEDGEDIVASIIAQANESGSEILLNANKLNLTGSSVVINTDNFKVNVNGDGKVTVKGAIEATSLTISDGNGGSCDFSSTDKLVQFIQENQIQVSGEGGYDDSWLKRAFSQTTIEGGLITTGNLLLKDEEDNVTAGIIGSNSNGVKFFAGSNVNNINTADFRVLKDGTLYATKANVSGNITASSLEITNDATIGSGFINKLVINDSFINNLRVKNLGFSHSPDVNGHIYGEEGYDPEHLDTQYTEFVGIGPTRFRMGDFAQEPTMAIGAYHEGKTVLRIGRGVVQGFAERNRIVDLSDENSVTGDYGGVLDKDDYDYPETVILVSMNTVTPGYYYQNLIVYNTPVNSYDTYVALPPIEHFHVNEFVRIYNPNGVLFYVVGGGLSSVSSAPGSSKGIENVVPIEDINVNSYYSGSGAKRARSNSNSKQLLFTPNPDREKCWIMIKL